MYETDCFTRPIRIVTISELPLTVKNAMFHLFDADMDHWRFGALHYRKWSSDTSTLLQRLAKRYQLEGLNMPEGKQLLKEFVRQSREEMLREMTPEERLKGLPPEERLKGLPPEERLKGLPPEERLKGLAPEALRQALLAMLSPEERAALARMLTGDGTSPR